MFNFLKKKSAEDVPPDVGKEEELDNGIGEEFEADDTMENEEDEEEIEKPSKKKGSSSKKSKTNASISSNKFEQEQSKLEFEKLHARLESTNELIKGYGERMSVLSQQIGEVRAMTLANEKSISKVDANSARAVDIVNEVRPEKLRMEYQKSDMKIQALGEKIESDKQFMDAVMSELKDIRSKIGTFLGTEELLRLNQDVKNDLIETQHMATKARMYSDKTEQLFSEMKRGFAESQKLNEIIKNLDANYSGMIKDVQKLKIDFSSIVNQNDFNDFKKTIETKIKDFERSLGVIGSVKEENERLGRVIETILGISQQNKRDIADIAVTIGDDHIKKVSDYNERLNSILGIIDELAGQISILKKKAGIAGKVSVEPRKIIYPDKVKLKNLDVHPEVSKSLSSNQDSGKKPEPENLKNEVKDASPGVEKSKTEYEKSISSIETDVNYKELKNKDSGKSEVKLISATPEDLKKMRVKAKAKINAAVKKPVKKASKAIKKHLTPKVKKHLTPKVKKH